MCNTIKNMRAQIKTYNDYILQDFDGKDYVINHLLDSNESKCSKVICSDSYGSMRIYRLNQTQSGLKNGFYDIHIVKYRGIDGGII